MIRLPDISKIDRLFELVEVGKSKGARTRARNELRSILNKLSSIANARMRSLESAGLAEQSPSYRAAQAFTERHGRRRFSTSAKTTKAEFYALRTFLGSETSTLRGARAMRNKSISRLRDRYPQLEGWTDREIEELQEFMGHQGVAEYFSLYPDSDPVVEQLIDVIEGGEYKKAKQIFDEYAKYLRSVERGDEETSGLTNVQVRNAFNDLYESIDRRKR